MRTSQNPYSVYDLLGYLIPGLLSILGTSLIFDNDFSTGHLTVGFWKSININAFSLNHTAYWKLKVIIKNKTSNSRINFLMSLSGSGHWAIM